MNNKIINIELNEVRARCDILNGYYECFKYFYHTFTSPQHIDFEELVENEEDRDDDGCFFPYALSLNDYLVDTSQYDRFVHALYIEYAKMLQNEIITYLHERQKIYKKRFTLKHKIKKRNNELMSRYIQVNDISNLISSFL